MHSMIPATAKRARARDADAARDSGQARGHSRRHVGGIGRRRAARTNLRQSRHPVYAEDKTFAEGQAPPSGESAGRTGILQDDGHESWRRDFTWTDLHDKRRVAIVSENLAREWWGDPVRRWASGFAKRRADPGAKSWASSKTSTTTACT